VALLSLGLTGCETAGPFEPIEAEDVYLTLRMSGGFTGESSSFVLDGAAGEVRGGPCTASCGWAEGDLILPVSTAQVEDLAVRLERAGVIGLAGDYGTECCDQPHYDLTYRRGEASASVRGVFSRIPAPLMESILHLSSLGAGVLPVLVAPETGEADWPDAPFTLGAVDVSGRTLTADITYGGGCASHRMDLVVWGGWLESDPVQVNALISHDDGGDRCRALVNETRAFDLSPLARAWTEAYGASEVPIRIALRLRDPVSGSPLGRVIAIEF
jgi:hypothetical protein